MARPSLNDEEIADLKRLQAGIKRRIEESGLKQTEIEAAARLGKGFIKEIFQSRSRQPGVLRMHRLARALGCTIDELFESDDGQSAAPRPPGIPVRFRVAANFSGIDPIEYDPAAAPPPAIPPRDLPRHGDYFAALVGDRSASKLHAPGETVICAPVPPDGMVLYPRQEVLVRFFDTTLADGETSEILLGLLDRTHMGALTLTLRSDVTELPTTLVIRPPEIDGLTAAEANALFAAAHDELLYQPRPSDQGEILGRVMRVAKRNKAA